MGRKNGNEECREAVEKWHMAQNDYVKFNTSYFLARFLEAKVSTEQKNKTKLENV